MKSQMAMGKAMFGVTRSLQVMNKQMNMPGMQKMMMEFEKQSEMMEFKQEMMDDVLDDALGGDEEEEKTAEMVSQILDEVGIGLGSSMENAPMGVAQKVGASLPAGSVSEDSDLQARLQSLRGL